jgi:hypothetical protein
VDAERWRDLIAREALGDLTAAERDELDAELTRRGEAGRAEAARIREAVGSIGLAASPSRPPAGLRDRILASLPAESSRGKTVAESPAERTSATRAGDGGSRGRLWPWVAVAATVAAIALGLGSLRLRDDLQAVRAELATARARAAEAATLRDSLSRLVADVSSLVASNAVTLSGTSPDVAGRARVFIDVDTGRTLLLVDDLPVLPPDEVYQLWAIRDGTPTDAGAFRLDRAGPAWIELDESTDVSEADLLAVTVERAPGASAPTSDPILAGGT